MTVQRFIRRGTASNATARRLIAGARQAAPSVLRTTVACEDIYQSVMRCLAISAGTLAGIEIAAGKHFYYVASPKFAGRFYVVGRKNGAWVCSSPEPVVKERCIRQVEAYRAELVQRRAA